MTGEIIRPDFVPRKYQRPLGCFLSDGGKRAVAVWHRRAGKDSTAVELTKEAALKRIGIYWHMLPTLRQARQVVWDGIGADGRRFLDHWPGWRNNTGLVKHIRHDEMKIELVNGSLWQVVGSDNYNSLMGANPVGVVFSEYSLADPAAWEFIRPILAENGGWALFIYTPRGRNHGYSLYQMALKEPEWFAELLDISHTGAVTEEAIEAERRAGMPEELIRQEFYCSFDAPLVGSIYSDQMWAAESQGRITSIHHDKTVPVDTWWDLGRTDATAIWFVQHLGNEIHVIDYEQDNGREPADYANLLRGKQTDEGYQYGVHVYPHDAGHLRMGMAGKSIAQQFGDLGFAGRVQGATDVWDGINEVRAALSRVWFDRERCALGIEALKSYRKEEDERRSTDQVKFFRDKPLHDWASHAADAFRTGVVSGLVGQRVMRREPAPHDVKQYHDELNRMVV